MPWWWLFVLSSQVSNGCVGNRYTKHLTIAVLYRGPQSTAPILHTHLHMSLLPTAHITSEEGQVTRDQVPKLTNRCYYLLAGDDARSTINVIQQNLATIFGAQPKLILVFGMESDAFVVSNLCPVVTLTDLSRVAITCPDCDTVHRGVWSESLPEEAKGVGSFTRHHHCEKWKWTNQSVESWTVFANSTCKSQTYMRNAQRQSNPNFPRTVTGISRDKYYSNFPIGQMVANYEETWKNLCAATGSRTGRSGWPMSATTRSGRY